MDSERAGYGYNIEQGGLTASENTASIFQPDTLLAPQYFEDRSRTMLEPEERLVLAILEDAVGCFQENHSARQGRRKHLFDDAQKWMFERNGDWVFGFENICAVLGFAPEYIRDGLVRWRENELSKQRNRRVGNSPIAAIETHGQMAMRAAS
jgi:hypothetical protein